MNKSLFLLIGLAAALSACGGRQPLRPVEGQKLPAVPIGAQTAPTAQQQTTPSTQARPGRNVELLRGSDVRQDDPFNLPPGEPIPKAPDPKKKDGQDK